MAELYTIHYTQERYSTNFRTTEKNWLQFIAMQVLSEKDYINVMNHCTCLVSPYNNQACFFLSTVQFPRYHIQTNRINCMSAMRSRITKSSSSLCNQVITQKKIPIQSHDSTETSMCVHRPECFVVSLFCIIYISYTWHVISHHLHAKKFTRCFTHAYICCYYI